jgi:hypothetical protein
MSVDVLPLSSHQELFLHCVQMWKTYFKSNLIDWCIYINRSPPDHYKETEMSQNVSHLLSLCRLYSLFQDIAECIYAAIVCDCFGGHGL